jgi:hypothetical protein
LERLVTTSQAAEILGLSLQGVHYRIKKNQLKSIKQSGKTYVYIDDSNQVNTNNTDINQINRKENVFEQKSSTNEFNSIIEVKNEQIVLLKKSMKWMKKQYISEINRLEKNQKRIIEVFNSEIKLLQSAFNEMRSIYNKPQIQQPINQQSQTKNTNEEKRTFITVKEFFAFMKSHQKSDQEIKYIIFRAIRNNDYRFIYNKSEKKLLILNADFEDLIK